MELKDGMRWDYEAGWYYLDANDINDFLNDHAKNGWEAMTVQDRVDRVFCVFRRQVWDEKWLKRDAECRQRQARLDERILQLEREG